MTLQKQKSHGLLLLEEFARITGLTNKQIAELYGCSLNYVHKMRSMHRPVQLDRIIPIIYKYGFRQVGWRFEEGIPIAVLK